MEMMLRNIFTQIKFEEFLDDQKARFDSIQSYRRNSSDKQNFCSNFVLLFRNVFRNALLCRFSAFVYQKIFRFLYCIFDSECST